MTMAALLLGAGAKAIWVQALESSGGSHRITRSDANQGGGSSTGTGFMVNGTVGYIATEEVSDGAVGTMTAGVQKVLYYPRSVTNLAAIHHPTDNTQINLSWTAPSAEMNHARPATSYRVKFSPTAALTSQTAFNAATSFVQSWVPSTPGTSENQSITGLSPNTTYYVALEALDADNNHAYLSNSTFSVTLGVTPTSFDFLQVNGTSVALQWTTGNSGALNLRYELSRSTDIGFSAAVATVSFYSTLDPASTAFFSLTPNTTYHFRVRAYSIAGVPTAWVGPISTMTPLAVPVVTSFSGMTIQDITINWSSGGNPDGTEYQAERSGPDDPNFTSSFPSSQGTALSASYTGLAINTTYYFRVRAFSTSGIPPSDYTAHIPTMTLVNAVSAGSVTDIFQTSATFTWSLDPPINPDNSTFYRVDMSTLSDFTGVVHSSAVPDPLTAAAVTAPGLSPNTTYFARLRSLNAIGNPAASDLSFQYAGQSSFATDPVPPDAGTFVGVSVTVIQAAWSETISPNNGPGTRYQLAVSTSAALDTVNGSSVTTLSNAVISGLFANTTYYTQVRAEGHSGANSGYLFIGATTTIPLPPTNASFASVGVTSVTVSWNSNSNGPTTLYRVQASTTNFGVSPLVSTDTLNTSAIFVDLSTNTSHYFSITVLSNGNGANQGPLNISTSTLSAMPGAATPPFLAVNISSITPTWSDSANPSGTRFLVEASSDSSGAFAFISGAATVTGVSNPFTGLIPNTSYYFRVSAVSNSGAYTEPLVIGATSTLAALPVFSSYVTGLSSITVSWSTNQNPADTMFYAENFLIPANNSGYAAASTFADVGLSTNTRHAYRVKARNRLGVETDWAAFASTRTRAAVPPNPVVNAFSKSALQILISSGSNPIDAPNRTQFAIQAVTVDPDLNAHAGLYLGTRDSSNVFTLNGSTPVWRDFSDWDPFGVVFASGLSSGQTYDFRVFARNGDQGTLVPGAPVDSGIPTEPSGSDGSITGSGAPVIRFGSIRESTSWTQQVWTYNTIIGFTAVGSFHYHYRFGAQAATSDPGWNGKIQLGGDLGNLPPENGVDSQLGLAGFQVPSEGEYHFYVLGDDFPSGVHADTATAVLPFRIFVDTTLPVVPAIQAQFAPDDTTVINDGGETAESTPYFTWDAPVNGTPGLISPIIGYTYSLSTDTSVTPELSTSAAAFTTGRSASIETPKDFGRYLFKVRAVDEAGNWSEPPAEFVYLRQPDVISPTVESIDYGVSVALPNSDLRVAVQSDAIFTLTFSELMYQPSVLAAGSLQIVGIRNQLAETIESQIPITVTYDAAEKKATLDPVEDLKPGYRYEIRSTPALIDLGGNPLATQLARPFMTLMSPDTPNILLGEDGKTRVRFPARAWGTFPASLAINDDPSTTPMAAPAISNAIEDANTNALRNQGAFAQSINLKELNLYGEDGARVQGTFSSPVTVTVPYDDVDGDGIVDGTNPPVREDALALYWLDESQGIWVRTPASVVDKEANTVTVDVRHFSVYGIIGAPSLDLSGAYAYPVPFKPSLGHLEITFTRLSSLATIKIYTINGELVQELQETDGDGELKWDVTNRGGQPLASGGFLYLIENSQERKKGKLLIVK